MAGEKLKECTTRLETLLGEWPDDEDIKVGWVDSIQNEIEVQRGLME